MATLGAPPVRIPAPAIFDTAAGADAAVLPAKNWTVTTGGAAAAAATINGQRMRFVTGATGGYNAADFVYAVAKMPNVADVEILFKFEFSGGSIENYFDAYLRGNGLNPSAGYKVEVIFTGVVTLIGIVGAVNLGSATMLHSAGDAFWCRLRAQGTAISMKTWQNGVVEPAAWTVSAVSAVTTAAGSTGFTNAGGNAASSATNYLHMAQLAAL